MSEGFRLAMRGSNFEDAFLGIAVPKGLGSFDGVEGFRFSEGPCGSRLPGIFRVQPTLQAAYDTGFIEKPERCEKKRHLQLHPL